MECNKEEAIRAKGIAEKKMESKDFVGAQKFALKAQKLYPELENISQMILVCDVHCSADDRVFGNERDWYAILGLDPTSDEALIKKQYRKFALLLHPDKNRFAGATDAFKLIGEAQRVLLDSEKRSLHDSKRKATGRFPTGNSALKPASTQSNVGRHPGLKKDVGNSAYSQYINQQRQEPQQQTQAKVNDQTTFWTACPFCSVRYQYYKVVLNRLLHCQNCKKPFTGQEINAQSAKPGINGSQSTFPKQNEVRNKGPVKVQHESTSENFSSDEGFDGNVGSKNPTGVSVPKRAAADGMAKPSKRAKCSGSFCATEQGVKDPALKEDVPKTKNPAGVANDVGEMKVQKKNEKAAVTEDCKKSPDYFVPLSKSSSNCVTEPEVLEYPDADFSAFEKDRKQECFRVGQIWAVYDPLDAMPRFYALIRKVFSPGFKLRITWLESDADDEDETKWVEEGLPVSCGKFRLGHLENIEDHLMFSHLAHWEEGDKKNSYKICPRKGETWALFKNWDMKWHTNPDGKKKFEFEFVEVVSNYYDDVGVYVSYLGKVKGFACLFSRTMEEGMDSICIPPKEKFRFSHKVPSFQMTGEEREDVPKGSFELDPACLPTNIEEIAAPENVKVEAREMHMGGSSSESPPDMVEPTTKSKESTSGSRTNADVKTDAEELHMSGSCSESPPDMVEPMTELKEQTSTSQIDRNTNVDISCIGPGSITEDNGATSTSSPEDLEIPESEFYNFDDDKSPSKFKVGQVWALYSDEDGMPKYYGLINKIESLPEFRLHVKWLFACSPPKDIIRWVDKEMPISCGKFRLRKGELEKYTATKAFSHQLTAEHNRKENTYALYPRKGEVWALFKNWSATITCSELENCEYDLVEIIEESESETSVLTLEQVKGFKSVFKAQRKGRSAATVKIPRSELLRFSFQIPAFRLTGERGGRLQGFWELDPAALPVLFLCSS